MTAIRLPLLAALAVSLVSPSGAAEPSEVDLARQGYSVLKRYCYRCHGLEFRAAKLNVLDRQVLTAIGKETYVAAGDPAASLLWKRAGIAKDMPPEEEQQRPSAAELETLRRWIEAQAPFPAFGPRQFIKEVDVLTRIRDDLLSREQADRPFLRYFTLTNLHNLVEQYEERDLQVMRAALSKLANSLSWEENIALPTAVDADQTILCIDLRKLGWSRTDLWQRLLESYPYALRHNRDADPTLAAVATEVYELTDCDLPYLRADWFIANAARPPLYEQMLELPDTLTKLAELLKVDLLGDFRENRLLRAGLDKSGVSRQNRVLDRHPAAYGALHISYDFKPESPPSSQKPAAVSKKNIFSNPLGPASDDHPFPDLAFRHDGGEMIFHLPNGLQGYFLTDAAGKRIATGPIDVVVDPLHSAGTPEVTNGISCMACHDQGMKSFVDRLGASLGVFGEPRRKAERLMAPAEKFQRVLAEDQQRFLTALEQACGPFLGQTKDTSEPVLFAARHFQKDLSAADVAAELGIADVEALKQLIRTNSSLQTLGLGPLVEGGTIKRDQWQAANRRLSSFQRVANLLDCGTPYSVTFGHSTGG